MCYPWKTCIPSPYANRGKFLKSATRFVFDRHRQPAHTDVMWVAVHRRTCLGLSTCFQNCFIPFFPLPKKIGPNWCLGLEWGSYPSFSFQSENCAMARYASRHRWLGVQKFQIWVIKCQPTIGKS